MLPIILSYLAGIILETVLGTDTYFLIFVFIIGFFLTTACIYHKGHIKDIRKMLFVWIYSLVIFSIFVFGTCYTKRELGAVSYIYLQPGLYEIQGKVVDMKQLGNTQTLTVRVVQHTNLDHITDERFFPKYVKVNVSELNDVELFDTVELVGEISFENYNTFYRQHPLFFNYEFVNLNINTFYNVSYPKNFRQLVTHKTFYETAEQKFYSLAQNLKMRISTNMQEPYASVAEGITVGEQRNLEKDLKDIFKTSGLIHILVLSGANVALIISFFYYFVRKINSRYKRLKVILTLCFGWIFIFMTGITAPSTRAGIMASTNILSEYFSKNISTIYSLLVALFVLSLLSPLTLIFSASLHLSFLACFGLFVLAPILQKYFGNKFLGFFLSVFFGIFLTTTPYILALTGKSSVFGTLLTFLVEPFVVAITILSFTIILASFVHPLLSEFFGVLNTLCVKFVLLVADFGAQHLPLIYFSISKTELIIYYLVLGLIFLKLGQNGIIKKTKEYAE